MVWRKRATGGYYVEVRSGWHESKFVLHPRKGVLRGSRDRGEVAVGSRLITDRTAAFYTRAIQKYARGNLLDLGCGKAPLLRYYSNFADEATLVDWGNSMHPNPLLDHETDLNAPLPFADAHYDTVILSDVLEHIAEPQALVNEVSRILKDDGGILLLNVPFFYQIHEEPFDFHRYTSFSLTRMCEMAGLKIIAISPLGGAPEIMTDIASKLIQQAPFVGRFLAALLQSAGAWLTTFGPGRYVSNRTAERFPLAYALVAIKPTPDV